MTRVVAIVQARMGSTRLPKKTLVDVEGRPMLERVLTRTARAQRVDDVVVATTTSPQDDVLAQWCAQHDWRVHRGPEADVLARYLAAARAEDASVVVRITSDCPLVDPEVVDQVVEARADSDAAYAANILRRTFPRGLDVEAFTRQALQLAHDGDHDAASREHVTPYLRIHPDRFRHASVYLVDDLSEHRWTVDTQEDLELVRKVYRHFGHDRFTWQDVLAAVQDHPDWRSINAHVRQKETP